MLDGRIARPPSWSLDPGSPFGGPGPGRVGAGCCHGCRPTGPTGVAGGGWGSPEVTGRMNRRLPEVAHRRRGAAPCARLSCRMQIPVALAARAGVSTSRGAQGPAQMSQLTLGPGHPATVEDALSVAPPDRSRPGLRGLAYDMVGLPWRPLGSPNLARLSPGFSPASPPAGAWTMPTRDRRTGWYVGGAGRVQMLDSRRSTALGY